MTDEASEFLRDEMRGDCMAMIEHQEREIADLREQLAEKQERIEEQSAQISEIQRDWRKRTRDLKDEVDWLNAELHGAEQRARRRPLKTCHRERDEQRRLATIHTPGGFLMTFGLSKCSACGEVELIGSYCPNCGAKVVA